MLQLENVRKSYTTGDFTQVALDDVSIAFRDNEFVAILGPSGSGKTTLLNVVGGLDHYDSGNLAIDGIPTDEYSDRDWDTYRNNRIGFVFQAYNLIPHQSVLSNVELALTLAGVAPSERRRRAMAALSPWVWGVGYAGLVALTFAFPNPIMILILLLGGMETYKRFKARNTPEARAFHDIPRSTRIGVAVVYLGLAALLAVGMSETFLERDFSDV